MHIALRLLLSGLCMLPCLNPAYAQRTPVPIVDYNAERYAPNSGRTLQIEEVKAAFKKAAMKLNWDISEDNAPQKLIGTLIVSQKHVVRVNIVLNANSYSLTYRDSENMNYSNNGLSRNQELLRGFRPPNEFNEAPSIHPSYNTWVKQLVNAVNQEIRSL